MIRLDGTDLRRVYNSKKLLTIDSPHFDRKTPRSPNRQYLAYASGEICKISRNIIDLKSDEIMKLGIEVFGSAFYWLPIVSSFFMT